MFEVASFFAPLTLVLVGRGKKPRVFGAKALYQTFMVELVGIFLHGEVSGLQPES
jgi:hypothetical protein